jgi:broad specificity phosphatase PhoE/ribonuclease HI
MRGVPAHPGAYGRIGSVTTRVVIEADGGSRGNPGPAGFGAVVRDADTGEVLREVADGIGVASNNVAEYRGLIAGLEAALDLGADEAEVRMDSLLVVNQMSSKWQVKHASMRPLAAEAAALVRRFRSVRFMHVRREFNTYADRLANAAMDAAALGRRWSADAEPPGVPAKSAPTTGWVAPRGPHTRLLLVRHGATALSPELRFSGRGDVELSDLGRAQAAAVAERLRDVDVTAIVSSPLQRAASTAAAIAAAVGVDVGTDDDLVETDFGAWEGRTSAEIAAESADEMRAWRRDPALAPPGGESCAAVLGRGAAARARRAAAHVGGTVAVVSHVTPIKSMLRDALAAPTDVVFRIHLDPASLSVVDWYPESGSGIVRLVNDTGHLGAELRTPS